MEIDRSKGGKLTDLTQRDLELDQELFDAVNCGDNIMVGKIASEMSEIRGELEAVLRDSAGQY